jgi:hypothetical protein
MQRQQQKELFYNYAIPESRAVIRDTFRRISKVRFSAPRPPLLFIAGGRDRLIRSAMNYSNYLHARKSNSITYYKEFKEHNHLIFDYPAYGESADFILSWLDSNAAS